MSRIDPFRARKTEDGEAISAHQRAVFLLVAVIFTTVLLWWDRAKASERQPVDTAIVLAADVSASMSMEHLRLQREAYAAALEDPAFMGAVRSGPHGRIALTYFEFSGQNDQRPILPWIVIATPADAAKAAQAMRAAPNAMGNATAVGAAINYAVGLLLDYGGEMGRAIIDVSGDGPTNDGPSSSVARDRAVALGATINGLPIANPSEPDTVRHYREEVIGGPGAFLIEARGMQDFGGALRQKLILELGWHSPSRTAYAAAQ
jgi:hypothetical protein